MFTQFGSRYSATIPITQFFRTALTSPGTRLALRAGGAALLWLLTANTAEAAPQPCVHQPRAQAAKSTTVRKVMRRLKALSTNSLRMRRARAGLLFDFSPRLHRTGKTRTNDDHDAIQNDGPITILDAADRDVFVLRPLGIVACAIESHGATLSFSPRSPRGPPHTA